MTAFRWWGTGACVETASGASSFVSRASALSLNSTWMKRRLVRPVAFNCFEPFHHPKLDRASSSSLTWDLNPRNSVHIWPRVHRSLFDLGMDKWYISLQLERMAAAYGIRMARQLSVVLSSRRDCWYLSRKWLFTTCALGPPKSH